MREATNQKLLLEYADWLSSLKITKRTSDFYLKDAKRAIIWINSTFGHADTPSEEMITSYEDYLTTTRLSGASIKRIYSSLRNFRNFLRNMPGGGSISKKTSKKHYWHSMENFTFPLLLFTAILGVITFATLIFQSQEPKVLSGQFTIPTSVSLIDGKLDSQKNQDVASFISVDSPESILKPEVDGGRGIIKKGASETTIFSNKSSQLSGVVVTSFSKNINLYIKKQDNGFFVVATDGIASEDLEFNWIIVNSFWYLDTVDR